MAGSVNRAALVQEYQQGASLTDLAARHKISVSTARYHVLKAGALRSRKEGIKKAAEAGKLGRSLRGRKRTFSPSHKAAIAKGRAKWGEENAVGVSVKPAGYREYTRGEHKGRSEHVVKMEERLGRRLMPDEHVHHIDGNRLNNADNNLALVTRSGHARIHRLQDAMAGKQRERDQDGRFC